MSYPILVYRKISFGFCKYGKDVLEDRGIGCVGFWGRIPRDDGGHGTNKGIRIYVGLGYFWFEIQKE